MYIAWIWHLILSLQCVVIYIAGLGIILASLIIALKIKLYSVHRWMTSRVSGSNACPVCKAAIEKDKFIPIYVRGRDAKDPR